MIKIKKEYKNKIEQYYYYCSRPCTKRFKKNIIFVSPEQQRLIFAGK